MNRIEFDKLEVLEQIKYINSQLREGVSLRNISGALSISKTTIRDRFKKIGYILNADTKQYYKNNTLNIQTHESIIKVPQGGNQRDIEYVGKGNTKELLKHKDDLMELINYKSDILEMLKNYKNNTKIIEMPQLDINVLPTELQTDIITKSIKVYQPISDLFDELCHQYNSIKKQDLVSMALYEFYNRYKK